LAIAKWFVKNIAYSATEEDLREHLSDIGTCSICKIVRDYDTGRSRGFAFVTIDTVSSDVEEARRQVFGRQFMERSLHVEDQRPMPPKSAAERAWGAR